VHRGEDRYQDKKISHNSKQYFPANKDTNKRGQKQACLYFAERKHPQQRPERAETNEIVHLPVALPAENSSGQ
jgi:hypothetical protein